MAAPRRGAQREVREVVYTFPQQMDALRGPMAAFIRTLFAKNVYQGTPQMRGVYFTSGTQEGRVIDRVMQRMADAFGVRNARAALPAVTTEARSYFLRDVFARVIFPDQDIAVRSPDEERRERNRRYLIAAGVFGFAALVSALPTMAYFENRKMLRETRKTVEEIATHRALQNGSVLPWNTMGALLSRVRDLRTRSRLTWQWGMYRGNRLREPLNGLFASEMRRDVGEPVVRVEQRELNGFAQQFFARVGRAAGRDAGAAHRDASHLPFAHGARRALAAVALGARAAVGGRSHARELGAGRSGRARPCVSNAAARRGGALHRDDGQRRSPRDARQIGVVRDVRFVLNRTPAADLSLERIKRAIDQDGFGLGLADIVGPAVTVLRSPRARARRVHPAGVGYARSGADGGGARVGQRRGLGARGAGPGERPRSS